MPPTNNPKNVRVTKTDIQENTAIALLSYISILCFVPLLLKKKSPYAQFHARQGLALFIIEVCAGVLSWTILLSPIAAIIYFVCMLFSLYGIYLCWTGQTKEIPLVSTIAHRLNI
jgi:uncharacterized membrane protein